MEYNSITRLSITLILTIMLISLTSATLSYTPSPITLQSGNNYFGAVFNESANDLSFNVTDSFDLGYAQFNNPINLLYSNGTDIKDGDDAYDAGWINVPYGPFWYYDSGKIGNPWETISSVVYDPIEENIICSTGGYNFSKCEFHPNINYTFNSQISNLSILLNQSGIIRNTGLTFHQGWNNFTMQITDRTIPLSTGQNLIGISSKNDININNLSFQTGEGNLNIQEAWFQEYLSGTTVDTIILDPITNKWITNNQLRCELSEELFICDGLLKARQTYWITTTESINMTFQNVGGTQVGDSFPLANVKFSNGTSELNLSAAVSTGWVGSGSVNSVFWYYNNSASPLNRWVNLEPLICAYDPDVEQDICIGGPDTFNSWGGYYITSNLNNIQMIFDEINSSTPPEPPPRNESKCFNKNCRKGIKIGVGHHLEDNNIFKPKVHKIIIGVGENKVKYSTETVLPGIIKLSVKR